MGKISPVSSKYIIHATIDIEGVVDRPDVIGAIFGQTEGLLGSDLELRELQRSGRIGRIEVNVDTRSGKTSGKIIIPSSLDKAETCIVGAALEIIQRIGPCNAKLKVVNIEDVRISKRNFVVERAKDLLKKMMDSVMPDSQEIADEVAYSVRVMEITEYGRERLPAGPTIDESDEILVVEGRADVLNLLKHGFKNSIAMNGTNVPQTVAELTKQKVVTAFVDGDRGGKLIIKQLTLVGEIDYVAFAPDGKEVEELTKKELHKALRSRISLEQAKLDLGIKDGDPSSQIPLQNSHSNNNNQNFRQKPQFQNRQQQKPAPRQQASSAPAKKYMPTAAEKKKFKEIVEDIVGTRGAYILDEGMKILGKVPVTELTTTIKSLNSGIHAVVFDGAIDKDVAAISDKTGVKVVVGMESKVKDSGKVTVLTINDL